MLFLLIDHGLWEKGLDQLVDELVRFVGLHVEVLEVETNIAGPLMSEFQRVLGLLKKASEYE